MLMAGGRHRDHLRHSEPPGVVASSPLQLENDIGRESCDSLCMELQTGRIFEPEVAEVDGYWVHVAVALTSACLNNPM